LLLCRSGLMDQSNLCVKLCSQIEVYNPGDVFCYFSGRCFAVYACPHKGLVPNRTFLFFCKRFHSLLQIHSCGQILTNNPARCTCTSHTQHNHDPYSIVERATTNDTMSAIHSWTIQPSSFSLSEKKTEVQAKHNSKHNSVTYNPVLLKGQRLQLYPPEVLVRHFKVLPEILCNRCLVVDYAVIQRVM